MKRRKSLHDADLKARLERLMGGDLQVDDITKLYVGKRSASHGRASFREIADFVAHPDLRNRGPVTDRIRDMRTTFKPMLDRSIKDETPSLEDLLARSVSNLRMASAEQIERLAGGRKRRQVEKILLSAVGKLRNGAVNALTKDEVRVAISFGDRLIWNPALRAQEVFEDFRHVMEKNGLLQKSDSRKLDSIRPLVILHAIAVMHGTAFDLGDGMTGELQAGFNNSYGCLEVTAILTLDDYPKDVFLKVGLFWTDLLGRDYVEPALIDHPGPWSFAIEILGACIKPIGNIAPNEALPDDIAVINVQSDQRLTVPHNTWEIDAGL
ncbi:MAG: hypothetical protein GY807_16270 [Gammaproteobacteria bacterium]|nr:hypothetical protein [Gammaproteobacteria bacterium]